MRSGRRRLLAALSVPVFYALEEVAYQFIVSKRVFVVRGAVDRDYSQALSAGVFLVAGGVVISLIMLAPRSLARAAAAATAVAALATSVSNIGLQPPVHVKVLTVVGCAASILLLWLVVRDIRSPSVKAAGSSSSL